MVQAKKETLDRLRRIEGQVRGLHKMIEEGNACDQIVTQLLAVRAGLDKVGVEIISNHAQECARAVARQDDPVAEGAVEAETAGAELKRAIDLFLRLV